MFSEPMLVYYIGVFRDAFWPNGKLAPPPRAKSDEQKQETKQRAQQKLLENIPGEITLILLKEEEKKYGWSTLTVPPTAIYQPCISSQLILFSSCLWHQAQNPQAAQP